MEFSTLKAQPCWTSWQWVVNGADVLKVAVGVQLSLNVSLVVVANGLDVSGHNVGQTAL